MDDGTMDEWNHFLEKKVKIVYEDGENHFSSKIGFMMSVNSTHMILQTGSKKEAINTSKILRVEEVNE